MAISTIGSFRDLVEVVVTAVSILGGFMAFFSGLAAFDFISYAEEPEVLAHRINRGLANGFGFGLPVAVLIATLLALI